MPKRCVKIEDILWYQETQFRAGLDESTVERYVEAINAGETLPPITVFEDRNTLLGDGEEETSALMCSDGWHRIEAYKRLGFQTISANVQQGKFRDAVLHAAGVNQNHGLPRTTADKRRAVETLLSDPEWSAWSDNRIAQTCRVSPTFVGNVRRDLQSKADDATAAATKRTTVRNGKTLEIDTSNIGRKKAAPLESVTTASDEPSVEPLVEQNEINLPSEPIRPRPVPIGTQMIEDRRNRLLSEFYDAYGEVPPISNLFVERVARGWVFSWDWEFPEDMNEFAELLYFEVDFGSDNLKQVSTRSVYHQGVIHPGGVVSVTAILWVGRDGHFYPRSQPVEIRIPEPTDVRLVGIPYGALAELPEQMAEDLRAIFLGTLRSDRSFRMNWNLESNRSYWWQGFRSDWLRNHIGDFFDSLGHVKPIETPNSKMKLKGGWHGDRPAFEWRPLDSKGKAGPPILLKTPELIRVVRELCQIPDPETFDLVSVLREHAEMRSR